MKSPDSFTSTTRQNILTSALDLFSRNGYDATSVAEICQTAGVSKGAFYHHFPSKLDLFLTLMTTWLAGMDGLFEVARTSADNVPDAIHQMAVISSGIFQSIDEGFPILLEFWTQASRQPEIWKRAVAPYRRYLAFLSDLIQDGIEEGTLEGSLDPESTGRILMALAMGLLLQASLDPDGVDWESTTISGVNMIIERIKRKV